MKVKRILLSLGLLTIGLINFGFCYEIGPRNGIGVPGQTFTSARRDTVDLYVSDNLNFSGTFDGITKDIFIVYARQFFYWNTKGEMSAYSANRANDWNNKRGGKLTYYYKCDSFNVPFTGFTNCVQFTYTGSEIQNVNNLLGRRNVNDDIVYGSATIGSTVDEVSYSPFIGFNIPNENISIVFYFKCTNSADLGYGLPYVYNQSYGIDYEYGGDYNSRNRPNTYAGQSPVVLGGNGENTTGNIETTTGQKFCPMIQLDITMYGTKYKSSLCRSDQTSGGTYINMFTAYPTRQDFLNSYNKYQQYCHSNSPRYDRQECIENLQALPYGKAGATITRNAIQSDLPLKKIYQYCRLQTHFTEEQKRGSGRCEFTDQEYYAPGLLSGATTEEEKNQLIQEAGANTIEGMTDGLLTFGEGDFITPEDGSIFDEILPNGIISWKNLVNINFIGNLTSIIAKILVLFKTRPIVDGILPPVILSLLLLIVLFKMYKK